MSWQQVITPNLNVSTSLGMCLKYVQDAFGSGWAGSYALAGWNSNTAFNHADRNIPSGVFVPVWFEGYWNGVNYGHVVIYKDGVCWSSPYSYKNTYDRLGSIAEVERIYGMKYIGWSEGLGGTRVIKFKEEDMIIPDADNYYWRYGQKLALQLRGRELSREEFRKFIVGRTDLQAVETLSDDVEADRAQGWQNLGQLATKDNWQGQIYTLQAQVKGLSSRPTKEQLDAANKKADDLARSADAATEAAKQALAKTAEADAKLKANEEAQAQSKQEADNFLTAILNGIRGMFGGK